MKPDSRWLARSLACSPDDRPRRKLRDQDLQEAGRGVLLQQCSVVRGAASAQGQHPLAG